MIAFLKFSMIAIAAILLSACTSTVNPVEITSKPADRVPLILPPADVINLRPVSWIVITKDNVDQVFADMESRGENLAVFALTATGYENLSLNISDIRKLTQQQRAIIVAYDNYINNQFNGGE